MSERKPSKGAMTLAHGIISDFTSNAYAIAHPGAVRHMAVAIDREAVAPAVRDLLRALDIAISTATMPACDAKECIRVAEQYRHLLDEPTTYGPTRSHDGDLVE